LVRGGSNQYVTGQQGLPPSEGSSVADQQHETGHDFVDEGVRFELGRDDLKPQARRTV
jgi:hypothetical protein